MDQIAASGAAASAPVEYAGRLNRPTGKQFAELLVERLGIDAAQQHVARMERLQIARCENYAQAHPSAGLHEISVLSLDGFVWIEEIKQALTS